MSAGGLHGRGVLAILRNEASRAPPEPPRAACAACLPTTQRGAPPSSSQPGPRPPRRPGRPEPGFWRGRTRSDACTRARRARSWLRALARSRRKGPRALAESSARGRVGATAHVRPPATSAPRCAAPSMPIAPPETTTAPARATLKPRMPAYVSASSAAAREPTIATTTDASVEPPFTVIEAGAPSIPRRREGYRESSGVR